jgi:hypothetical protein
MHIVFTPHAAHVEWRTSDGRTGSDPSTNAIATMLAIIRRLGANVETLTVEIIYP